MRWNYANECLPDDDGRRCITLEPSSLIFTFGCNFLKLCAMVNGAWLISISYLLLQFPGSAKIDYYWLIVESLWRNIFFSIISDIQKHWQIWSPIFSSDTLLALCLCKRGDVALRDLIELSKSGRYSNDFALAECLRFKVTWV